MENIKNFEISTSFKNINLGKLTILSYKNGIFINDSISNGEKFFLAAKIYDDLLEYSKTIYISYDNKNILVFEDEIGYFPKFFLSNDNKLFVSITTYPPSDELELSIPVFDRQDTSLPKGTRPFVGDYIGNYKNFAVFHSIDIFDDKKPDKLLLVEFINGKIKSKKNIKLPFPKNNHIFVDENINLVSKDGNNFLHRKIDEKGNIFFEKTFSLQSKYFLQILDIQGEKIKFLVQKNGKLYLEIFENGKSDLIYLIDFENFYATFRPKKMGEDYIFNFTFAAGNGRCRICKDKIVEFFYSVEGGYKNLVDGKFFELKKSIISGIEVAEKNYHIIFYERVARGENSKKVYILSIKS